MFHIIPHNYIINNNNNKASDTFLINDNVLVVVSLYVRIAHAPKCVCNI
jgi:hypothetical protein